MTTIINAKDFLYMTRFMSDDYVRYYLKGVSIEPKAGHVMLVATDGHKLGVLKVEQESEESKPFILAGNKDLIRACKVGKKSHAYIRCGVDTVDVIETFAEIKGDLLVELANVPVNVSFPAKAMYVDGTFPDWRQVMPNPSEVAHIRGEFGIRPENLECMAAMDGESSVFVDWNKGSAALVTNNDPRFLGVVMPTSKGLSRSAVIARWESVMGKPAVVASKIEESEESESDPVESTVKAIQAAVDCHAA